MADKQEERIASALKSLSSNGLTLPAVDRHNYEALIGEYFYNSASDDDDTGSEDEQVNFLGVSIIRYAALFIADLLGGSGTTRTIYTRRY